jgi:hypothetical protein
MSRVFLCLGCVGLTLGLASSRGGPIVDPGDSTPVGHATIARTGGDPGGGLVVRIAQKKVRKKDAPKAAEAPAEKAAEARDTEGLKFSRDIAPILVANCVNCHKEGGRGFQKAKLDLTTFEKIMKGTPGEVVIVAGKPDESHLYLRVAGEETPRMPPGGGNNRLADSAIERIGRWIREGAKIDSGIDPKAMLASYASSAQEVRRAELAKLTPEQRDKAVEDKALERWKKGSPKATPEVFPSKTLVLVGVVPRARASAALKALEPISKQVRSLVGTQGGADPVEKVGLYVFNDRPSFVEFARSVEKKELESTDVGLANLDVEAPYVAALDPLGGRDEAPQATRRPSRSKKGSSEADASGPDRSLAGVLAEQLAIGEVKAAGEVPSWLSRGLGAYFASRVDPRSLDVQRLRKNAYDLANQGWVPKATEAMGGEARADQIRAVGFAIVEWMATDPGAREVFPDFVRAMAEKGAKLDDVIGRTFNGTRQDLLQASGEFVGTHYGRR